MSREHARHANSRFPARLYALHRALSLETPLDEEQALLSFLRRVLPEVPIQDAGHAQRLDCVLEEAESVHQSNELYEHVLDTGSREQWEFVEDSVLLH
jgi:hypothetical protein